jgi:RNA polymerase sigma factor (TIGR02999 family)
MAREMPGRTLQAPALVHEAWLRLGADHHPAWQSRRHFFGAAAEAMRRILVEQARRRRARKRGGGETVVPLDEVDVAVFAKPKPLSAEHRCGPALRRNNYA